MKNTIVSVIVAILIIGGIRLAIKGGQYQYAEHQVNNGKTFISPPTAKEEFMEGCNPDNTNTSYCECTYDTLIADLGDAGFQKMALEYNRTGVISESMYRASDFCIDKYIDVENY